MSNKKTSKKSASKKSASKYPLDEILIGVEKLENDLRPAPPSRRVNTSRDTIRNAILDRMGIKTAPTTQQIQRPIITAERKPSLPTPSKYLKDLTTSRGSELNPERMEEERATDMVSEQQLKIITGYLNSPPRKYEVEASLGSFIPSNNPRHKYPRFVPGMNSIVQFNNVINSLRKRTSAFGGSMSERSEISRVDILINPEDNKPYPTRRIVQEGEDDKNGILQIKTGRNNVDIPRWGFRFKKTEEHFDVGDFDFNKLWKKSKKALKTYKKSANQKYIPNAMIQRYRRRISFQDSTKGPFYGVSIDLTIITEVYIRADGGTSQNEKYEVEIERLSTAKKRHLDAQKFLKIIRDVIELAQDVQVPYQLMGTAELGYVSKFHNHFFHSDIKKRKFKLKGAQLFSGYWNEPKNVKLINFLDERFDPAVTVKLDGTRRFVIVTPIGVYMVKPGKYFEIYRIGPVHPELEGTMLDCEYVEREDDHGDITDRGLYVFDILFNKYQDVRSQNFIARTQLVTTAAEMLDDHLYTSRIYAKKFYTKDDGDVYKRNKLALAEAHKLNKKGFETDGIILQPGHWYKNNHTYKWKPSDTMTIDFLMKKMTDEEKEENSLEDIDDDVYWLLVTDRDTRELVPFKGNPRSGDGFSGYMIFTEGTFEKQSSLDNRVIECKWDYEYEAFYSYRFRDDRGGKPNFLQTAVSVFQDIIRPISRETMEGNTLRIMRKYHNHQKNSLLKAALKPGDTIIDIGSGRGGDLLKWKNIKLNKVYAIEPDETNADEFVRRRDQILGEKGSDMAVLLEVGAENTDEIAEVIEEDEESIDAVVGFFSLTFAAQSKEIYEGILDTIDLVKPGGLFIGAVMEGHRVRELLEEKGKKKSKKSSKMKYSTDAYSLKQLTSFTDDTFGNMIELNITDTDTSVFENQKEALFYFSNFLKEMKSRGFILKKDGTMDSGPEFEKLPGSSQTFSSLMKFFVFEKEEGKKKETKKKSKKSKKDKKKKKKKKKKEKK